MNKFAIVAKIDLTLGLAFLIFGTVGLLLHVSGFTPTGVVFIALGLVQVLVFWQSKRRGYTSPVPKTDLFATMNMGQEEKHLLQVVLRTGYSYRDQVGILVDSKEEISSGWALGRKREYDLSVGDKEKHELKVKLRRGPEGSKYEFYADSILIGEGKLQPSFQTVRGIS